MIFTAEAQKLLYPNPNGTGYILKDGLTKDEIQDFKEINKFYKKTYGKDFIHFD